MLQLIEGLRGKSKTPDYYEFSESEGSIVLWTASLVLLNHLILEGSLKGKRVLELGSGLGHLAVGCARQVQLSSMHARMHACMHAIWVSSRPSPFTPWLGSHMSSEP